MKMRTLVPPPARKVLADVRHRVAARSAPHAVFVRIPKTGSTSVFAALHRRGMADLKPDDLRSGQRTLPSFVMFGHATLTGLEAEGLIDADDYADATRFTFVRNPWDRAVSVYYHMRHHRDWPMFDDDTSFAQYLEAVAVEDPRPGAYHNRGLSSASPQMRWFDGTGRIDFVGRTEQLEADLPRLCRLLGVRAMPIPTANRSRYRVERDYRDAYDATTRRLVETIYAEDIEAFGYDF